ncbi:hypothetical protein EVAR_48697_1 [Eumeta japonica]|uniref:Uncharacterized protein n=1 Tax=Eumeta variegata TaxID=151549 RepID=A0A4C1XCG3_EUMVA|nr:hypothetical protein EVAR_48697_1 [Eumeta japonica]
MANSNVQEKTEINTAPGLIEFDRVESGLKAGPESESWLTAQPVDAKAEGAPVTFDAAHIARRASDEVAESASVGSLYTPYTLVVVTVCIS